LRPADFRAIGRARSARGERAKKISPVIFRNLQPNQSLGKIVTGDNRSLLSSICRLFSRAFAREGADAIVRRGKHANSADRAARLLSVIPCVPMPASSKRAFLRGKTPNMATQTHARNRTNVRFEKIVGTKLESLARISAECFCASGAYEGRDFFKPFFDPAIVEFPAVTRADQPGRFDTDAIKAGRRRPISENHVSICTRSDSDPKLPASERS
jgi:hypothetical protein